ncbi:MULTISPECIES: hypothetical protein [Paenibacillus]|uniref:Uncharacterized protein n=1 Tax=Paenibacillus amylolyticus TaxID=1451 RepID=A0ABD8AZ53_PAEAM|nr:hypothetical protein [Paenibacillus sp. VT-400]
MMCRYALSGPYKDIYACFICRKSFKQVSRHDLSPEVVAQLEYKCPQCATSMVSMGQDFQAPKQNDTKQWTKVMMLYRHGFTYHNCGCGAGYRPADLRELSDFLEQQEAGKGSEGKRLLQRLTS